MQASIKAEAERLAKAEGTTLNQFINVAVAEKIAVLRTADFFRERAAAPTCLPPSPYSTASTRRNREMSWRSSSELSGVAWR